MLTSRPFQFEDDYWRIRAFLRDTFLRNGCREHNWQVSRLDYWRWHVIENIVQAPLSDLIELWETPDKRIAAALIREWPGDVFFQVDPDLRTPDLEAAMLAVAEQRMTGPTDDGRKRLQIWATRGDTLRENLLAAQGYTRGDWPEYQHKRDLLAEPLPDAPLAPGYTIRALGDLDEHPRRSWLSWRVFHPDEPDEKYEGYDWYVNVQRCPMYRRDLDLVAVAADGEFAAFTTIWYDDVTRTGTFEPVGTEPNHQRRGLARAVMCEGLRRLVRMGGTRATVGGYSEGANTLYDAVVGPTYDLYERWEKTW